MTPQDDKQNEEIRELKQEAAIQREDLHELKKFADRYGPMIDDIYRGIKIFILIGKFLTWCSAITVATLAIMKGLK